MQRPVFGTRGHGHAPGGIALTAGLSLRGERRHAAVDGVDALFVGPGDLAATLGYPGEPGHPEFKRVLAEAGCTLDDVVKVTTYLEDARDFGRYNGVFKEYFPEGRIARTTVEARAVISTKIEIECVAYKPL